MSLEGLLGMRLHPSWYKCNAQIHPGAALSHPGITEPSQQAALTSLFITIVIITVHCLINTHKLLSFLSIWCFYDTQVTLDVELSIAKAPRKMRSNETICYWAPNNSCRQTVAEDTPELWFAAENGSIQMVEQRHTPGRLTDCLHGFLPAGSILGGAFDHLFDISFISSFLRILSSSLPLSFPLIRRYRNK